MKKNISLIVLTIQLFSINLIAQTDYFNVVKYNKRFAEIASFTNEKKVWLITASEMNAAGFSSGAVINSIQLKIFTPLNITTTQDFVVFLQNTNDTTNLKPNIWGVMNNPQNGTVLEGMTLFFNGNSSLPNTSGGIINLPFNGTNQFIYNGGGLYIAYEKSNQQPSNNSLVTLRANKDLLNGTKELIGNATQLNNNNFRPETILGKNVNCAKPTNVISTANTNNSATISWTGSEIEIEYGSFGFIQGTGILINYSTNPTNLPSTSPFIIQNLLSNKTYQYYVRTKCGNNLFSSWSGPFVFNTNNVSNIYNNGGANTGALSTSNVASPNGYFWSECQRESNSNQTVDSPVSPFSFYAGIEGSNAEIADNFIVPSGKVWNINGFEFLAAGNPKGTNFYDGVTFPFNRFKLYIYDTDPSLPNAIPIYGEYLINAIDELNSGESNLYRIGNTLALPPIIPNSPPPTVPVADQNNKIWRVRGSINATLTSGNYWVVCQTGGKIFGAYYCDSQFIPVTTFGVLGDINYNAKIHRFLTDTWQGLEYQNGRPQDLSFSIFGSKNDIEVLDSENFNYSSLDVSVYPNPIFQNFYLKINNDKFNSIEISDLNGRTISEFKYNNASEAEISLQNISSGIYLLKIYGGKKVYSKKIIKQ